MENKLGYLPKNERKKILFISDDIRVHSGVATVSRELVLNSCHHYNFVCVGGAIKHPDAGKVFDLSDDTNKNSGINDSSVVLYPVDGYGNPELLKQIIKIEKPDAVMFITDPRYFEWLFMMENEIRKHIPMIYVNIWDSPVPYPLWNKPYYESCDLLLAISKQTKNINEVVLGDKAKNRLITYLPHGLNHNIFKPLEKTNKELIDFKNKLFNGKEYEFTLFFNSRNIRRKQIIDTLLAYKLFIDSLPEEKAKKCAFVLHTDLVSENGTDLPACVDYIIPEYKENIIFSTDRLDPFQMNLLYNSTDCQILLSSNEGWGLSLTEAILVGNPIIANQQGGMIDQMRFEDENGEWINYTPDFPSNNRGTYKKHGEWSFPVLPSNISIQGSPTTPYISDDRCRPEDAATRISEVYSLDPIERKRRGLSGREWALGEAGFTGELMGNRAIDSIDKLFSTWKPRENFEIINATKYKLDNTRNTKLIY
jgi:hypothetical protein